MYFYAVTAIASYHKCINRKHLRVLPEFCWAEAGGLSRSPDLGVTRTKSRCWKAWALFGGSGGGSVPRLIRAVGSMTFLVVIRLRPWVPAGCQPGASPSSRRPPVLLTLPLLPASSSAARLAHTATLSLPLPLPHLPPVRDSFLLQRPPGIVQVHLPTLRSVTIITSWKSLP